VEILTADPYTNPHTRGTRYTITYRLSHHSHVIASGDDIDCPGQDDPTSDHSIRAIVNLLIHAPDPTATRSQRAFLHDHAEELSALLDPPDPPYPPGTRIAVTAPGRPPPPAPSPNPSPHPTAPSPATPGAPTPPNYPATPGTGNPITP